jgi:hypothetical protein
MQCTPQRTESVYGWIFVRQMCTNLNVNKGSISEAETAFHLHDKLRRTQPNNSNELSCKSFILMLLIPVKYDW